MEVGIGWAGSPKEDPADKSPGRGRLGLRQGVSEIYAISEVSRIRPGLEILRGLRCSAGAIEIIQLRLQDQQDLKQPKVDPVGPLLKLQNSSGWNILPGLWDSAA